MKVKAVSILVIVLSLALLPILAFLGVMSTDAPGSSNILLIISIAIPLAGVLVGVLTFFRIIPIAILLVPAAPLALVALLVGQTWLKSFIPDAIDVAMMNATKDENFYKCTGLEGIRLVPGEPTRLEYFRARLEGAKTYPIGVVENNKLIIDPNSTASVVELDSTKDAIEGKYCKNAKGQPLSEHVSAY